MTKVELGMMPVLEEDLSDYEYVPYEIETPTAPEEKERVEIGFDSIFEEISNGSDYDMIEGTEPDIDALPETGVFEGGDVTSGIFALVVASCLLALMVVRKWIVGSGI